ncbi:probable palmitoyltransferase ZDHHC20 [Anoplophora glabripennis]|uniref:probable palmitoyltransferase ZDHHC20 n=1 Tax=Anoplophora glabripennis TaxID=217634 RepID=UPI0008743520|nr:probable palmitoyltransferase ZDHHC20 [Anoplophora glabripennis]
MTNFCVFTVQNVLESVLYILFFNVLFILLLWSFLSTVLTPIATVPSKYKLTDEEIELFDNTDDINKNLILDRFCQAKNLVIETRYPATCIRYCFKCKHIKPDRARHCSKCGVCVLKMDHHCPWVNNCIGFSNLKNFHLFLLYSTLYSVYLVCTSLKYVEVILHEVQLQVVFVGYLIFFYAIFAATLLLYNCRLLCKNQTSIDALQAPIIAIENGTYDLGCRKNFLQVFGDKWRLWPFPIPSSLGTGCTFPIRILNTGSSV